MEDASNELFVSHASAWETVIKVSIGKLKLQTDCRAIFPVCWKRMVLYFFLLRWSITRM
jgi:PIN domain nuclease of toxin-antitoxin system